eukprot:COSAG04_NODE_2779_length_3595_cov_3.722826_2_plen_82_part_00
MRLPMRLPTSALTSRGGSGGFEEAQLLQRWPMPDGARSPGAPESRETHAEPKNFPSSLLRAQSFNASDLRRYATLHHTTLS